MPASAPDLHRVTVHAGDSSVDLTLPASVPVATLIPSILDVLGIRGATTATRYHLSPVGQSTLSSSTTLVEHGIRDGAVLLLTQDRPAPPTPHCDDVAEAVSAALAAAPRILGRHSLGAIATVFAALAGLLAVPGPPEAPPNVLLAAMAAAATSVLVLRVTGSGGTRFTAVAYFATVTALAALIGVLTPLPPPTIGSLTTLASFGLHEVSARMSIALSGLSPQLRAETDLKTANIVAAKSIQARRNLTSLQAAFSASAAAGAVVAVIACPQRASVTFAAVCGTLLLFRDRSMTAAASGIIVIATTFLAASAHGPWAAVPPALIAVVALGLSAAPAVSLSPIARRGVDMLEYLLLASLVPLAAWVCGAFSAVRSLGLP